ncbi:MAG: DUF4102 domain-containing protein, partial [Kordiimonadaceae bacterium]|nr:DUF4102 domain-containing protein [Kordiimonadaceae bacterium]
MTNLTKRTIDALKPEKSYYRIWDNSITGFGIKVTPAGSKIYFVKYRIDGIQRWYT